MKKIISVFIIVFMIVLSYSLISCGGNSNIVVPPGGEQNPTVNVPTDDNPTLIQLGTPKITISETGLASWNAIANASKYSYILNGGDEVETITLSLQLNINDTLQVKAIGDGIVYSDGKFSELVKYEEHQHAYSSSITKEATCTLDGVRTLTCSCGDSYTEVINKLGHNEVVDHRIEPTCTLTGLTEGKHCSRCNIEIVPQEVISALGHTEVIDAKVDATCTKTGLTEGKHCSVCNATIVVQNVINVLPHTEVIDQAIAATCTEKGKTEGKHCSVCDEVIVAQEDVAALGHTPAAAVRENEVPATCKAEGSYEEVVYCSVCDAELSRDTKTIEKLAHTEVIDKAIAPTCTEKGKTEGKHCSACNEVLVAQEDVAALGHTPSDAVKENEVPATCKAAGSYEEVIYCSVCDAELSRETKTIEKLAHTEVIDKAIAPTCTEKGKTEGKHCSVCNEVIVAQEDVAALGHTPAAAVRENEVPATCKAAGSYDEVVYCSLCDTELSRETKTIEKLSHTEVIDKAIAATCTEKGKTEGKHCSVCNEVIIAQEDVPALGHTPTAAVRENEVPATCKAAGSYDEVVYCSECDAELSRETKTIDKLAHTEVIDQAVAATCTEKGKTEGKHCSVCNEVIIAQEDIAALGHTPAAAVRENEVPATCKAAGSYEEVIYCSVCDAELSREDKTIEKLAHTEVIDKAIAPSCTEKGKTEGKHCSVCNEVIVAQEDVAALGHKSAAAVRENEVPATCKAAGSYEEVVYCSECDAELSRDTKTIEKLAHTEVIDQAVAATCTTSGKTEGKHCSDCNEVLVAQEEVAALGHKFGKLEVTSATCVEDGYITITCSSCQLVADSRFDQEAKDYMKEYPYFNLAAKGHTEVIDAAVAPTCTEKGKTEGKHCSVCNEVIVAQEDVSALGHKSAAAVRENEVPATCKAAGSYEEVVYCSECDTELSREDKTIDKLAHTEVIDKAVAPTCTEKGKTEGKHCSVCNEVIVAQEDVAALGHTPSDAVRENEVSSTCKTAGSYDEVVYCSLCDAELSRETKTIEKLAHTEVIDKAVDPTCTESGKTEGKHCSVCDEVIIAQEDIAALGHNYSTTWSHDEDSHWHTCSRCKSIDQKNAHEWDNGVVDVEPEINVEGFTIYTCDVCSRVERRSVGKLEHEHKYELKYYEVIDNVLYYVSECECNNKVYSDAITSEFVNAYNEADLDFLINNNYNVKLANDITITKNRIELTSENINIILDMAGFNISNSYYEEDENGPSVGIFFLYNEAVLTITGNGTLYGGKDSTTNFVICATEGSKVYIENGTYISGGCTVLHARGKSEIFIKDGTFKALVPADLDGRYYTIDVLESESEDNRGRIYVSGGSYYQFDPANHTIDGKNYTNKLVEGYHSIYDEESNSYVVNEHEFTLDSCYTIIDDVLYYGVNCECGYINLENKVDTTKEVSAYNENDLVLLLTNGYNVKLENDIEIKSVPEIEIKGSDIELVLNMNGKTISNSYENETVPGGILFVQDGAKVTVTGNGKMYSTNGSHSDYVITAKNNATVNIMDGYFYSYGSANIYARFNSVINIYGGKYEAHEYLGTSYVLDINEADLDETWGKINVYAGTFVNYNPANNVNDSTYTNKLASNEYHALFDEESNSYIVDKHEYLSTNTKPASCTEKGIETFTCICGDYYTRDIVALGHDEVEHEGQAATCTEKGHEAYVTCTRCDYTTYKVIEALGHDEVEHEGQAATCEEKGHEAYVTCTRCDYTTYKVIEALGHNEVEHEGQAATCEKDGYKPYVTCTRCDYTTYEVIRSEGHDEVEHEGQDATCTEEGHEAYVTCTRCDYTTYKVIEALGHKEVEVLGKDSTCKETGLTNGSKCENCDKVFKEQEIIPTKEHSWDSGIVTLRPTGTETGIKTYSCGNCGTTKEEDIPALLTAEGNALTSVKDIHELKIDEGTTTADSYYVLGYVKSIDIKTYTIVIEDGQGNTLSSVYKSYLYSQRHLSIDELPDLIRVGDYIVIKGKITNVAGENKVRNAEVRELNGTVMNKIELFMATYAAKEIKLNSSYDSDFALTVKGTYNSTVTWESKHESIKIEGSNAIVTISENDVTGKLIAFITQGEVTVTKEFEITVYGKTDEEKLTEAFNALSIKEEVYTDYILPSNGLYNCNIKWEVKSGTAIVITDNVITVERPQAGSGDANVVIVATLTLGNETLTKEFEIIVEELESDVPAEMVTTTIVIADYASTNSWVNDKKYTTLDGGTFTATVNGGGNTGKYYTDGYNWRLYQTESPTLTISSDKKIVSVTIEYNVYNSGALILGGEKVASKTTIEVNDNTITFNVGNTGTKTNGQVRIKKITVVTQ